MTTPDENNPIKKVRKIIETRFIPIRRTGHSLVITIPPAYNIEGAKLGTNGGRRILYFDEDNNLCVNFSLWPDKEDYKKKEPPNANNPKGN